MKYIRTKDGKILTTDENVLYDESGERWFFCNGGSIPVPSMRVIKYSNTIEELCDLYVIWLKNRELPLIERTQKGRRLYPSYFEVGECSLDKVYGAIWTDKGLIYVAKMNENGELELL